MKRLSDKQIRRMSWKRLTEIWIDGDAGTRRRIEAEAQRCGYDIGGLVLAKVLREGGLARRPCVGGRSGTRPRQRRSEKEQQG